MPLNVTFPAYSEGPNQQQLTGVQYGRNADLGYAVPLTVTTAADSDSASLIVVGYNSFMVLTDPTGGAGTYTLSWVHVDPTDSTTVLFVRQIQAGVSPASPSLFTFGAFGLTAPTTNGDVFHTGKLRLRAAGANVTFNNVRLWACKR